MTKLAILGAGGHGRVLADCAQASNLFEEIVFLDDNHPKRDQNLVWPIVGKTSAWLDYKESHQFALGIGDNQARHTLFTQLTQAGASLPNIIHPSAVISPHAQLGLGNVVFANAVINPNAHIGNAVIINTQVTVEHDCKIEDAVHLSPRVALAGTVSVGSFSWLGIGSSVIHQVNIAPFTQTGAGAVIINDTNAHALYVGVPAVAKKKLVG